MTGPTLQITPWQLDELRRYADGEPHAFGAVNANLVRRNLLVNVRETHGPSHYRLTEFGRALLDRYPAPPSIPEEAVYPRDEEHRYRLYARRGDELEVLAVGPRDSIGSMIVQLDEDERERGRRLVDLGAIGLLDAVAGRWLIMPWHRPTQSRLYEPPRSGKEVTR